MRIVSWNMNRLARSLADHKAAWAFLHEHLQIDLALVQEASPSEEVGTSVYHPIDRKRYNWGSAVVALSSSVVLSERERLPLATCYLEPPKARQLPDSHPGACAVADVLGASGEVLFTVVSLYGQWEVMAGGTEESTARLHRMLSDLTTLFLGRKRRPVVLAGDLNISTQWLEPARVRQSVAAAFSRIAAFGLVDCVARTRGGRPQLAGCPCGDGDMCSHVQTFRNKTGSDAATTQLDYVFASESMIDAVVRCDVVQTDAAWGLSDHCPIVLEIDEERLLSGRGHE